MVTVRAGIFGPWPLDSMSVCLFALIEASVMYLIKLSTVALVGRLVVILMMI